MAIVANNKVPAGDGDLVGEELRPTALSEFGGQRAVVRELGIVLSAAKARGELCDHLLFSGPPGLGKTTLAGIVARELNLTLVATSGPAIEQPGELAAILTGLDRNSCLFIDEIHRLRKVCEEVLYTAMEDGYLDLVVGEGSKTRSVRLELPPFLLIGATTQVGLLSAPLRDRFGYAPRLRLYGDDDLAKIVTRSSKILGMDIKDDAAQMVASRGRGTPRLANRLLKRVRDYVEVAGVDVVDADVAAEAMEAFGIDSVGLDHLGREILEALCGTFGGHPVGLTTLAAAVGEAPTTLEEVYEPYLMSRGLLMRTPRGRCATEAAYEHLGRVAPPAVTLAMSHTMTQVAEQPELDL